MSNRDAIVTVEPCPSASAPSSTPTSSQTSSASTASEQETAKQVIWKAWKPTGWTQLIILLAFFMTIAIAMNIQLITTMFLILKMAILAAANPVITLGTLAVLPLAPMGR